MEEGALLYSRFGSVQLHIRESLNDLRGKFDTDPWSDGRFFETISTSLDDFVCSTDMLHCFLDSFELSFQNGFGRKSPNRSWSDMQFEEVRIRTQLELELSLTS